jgi:hypothetical protein
LPDVTLFVRFTVVNPEDKSYKQTRTEFFEKLIEALKNNGGTPHFYRKVQKGAPPQAPRDVTLFIDFASEGEADDFLADVGLREIAKKAEEKGLISALDIWLTEDFVPEGWTLDSSRTLVPATP